MNGILFVSIITACVSLSSFVCEAWCAAKDEKLADAMVKIHTVFDSPRYWTPWSMKGPSSMSGSGCIISGNRILTNAHVVSDQTYIEVQRHGEAKRFTARVIDAFHEADLALLTVDDHSFFDGVEPLSFGPLPETEQEVLVFGFPMGGDSLSVTQGVVSRLEHQVYAHSSAYLLAGQIDAAINPGNSGGPVLIDGKIVGVVMQGYDANDADNIGYMVPVSIIQHYLDDLSDKKIEGFPALGIVHFNIRNPSAKAYHKLKDNQTGRVITDIHPLSPFKDLLRVGDVVVEIDGKVIADDGTIEFRPRERTSLALLVQSHQLGDELKVTYLRNGQQHTVQAKLTLPNSAVFPIPTERYDVKPSYYVYGGLVFTTLTKNLLHAWGNDWEEDAPHNFLGRFFYNRMEYPGQEIVVLLRVLPSKISTGYHEMEDLIVSKVDGTQIKNLSHLIKLLEQPEQSSRFSVIETDGRDEIVLDRLEVKEFSQKILERYDIPFDRSEELRD